MKIDIDAIRQLADLIEETGLTEIEVADGDKMIRVNKGGVVVNNNQMHAPINAHSIMSSDPTIPQAANTNPPLAIAANHAGAVTSPMVGTIYMQAEPNSPPFISKGANVKVGDTLVIIEAMKVMNPIKATKAGTVTQVFVDNGHPVEFGEVLLVIE